MEEIESWENLTYRHISDQLTKWQNRENPFVDSVRLVLEVKNEKRGKERQTHMCELSRLCLYFCDICLHLPVLHGFD